MEKTNIRGFTLIELMVVIVIIGLLAGMAVPMYGKVREKARDTEIRRDLSIINVALSQFGVDNNGLYPYRIRALDQAGGEQTTSDVPGFYPLALIGGANTVDESGVPRSTYIQQNLVQPRLDDVNQYYYFNQYTDPLVALGYLNRYPQNPFFPRDKRPMGATVWAFLQTDLTIPAERVIITPGDFVYTANMGDALAGGAGGTYEREDPKSTVPRALSYQVDLPSGSVLRFSLDLVDSYQLWAYGALQRNGASWASYPNNFWSPGIGRRATPARKDWNGNGIKDMFERGIALYYAAGTRQFEQSTSTGGKIEY